MSAVRLQDEPIESQEAFCLLMLPSSLLQAHFAPFAKAYCMVFRCRKCLAKQLWILVLLCVHTVYFASRRKMQCRPCHYAQMLRRPLAMVFLRHDCIKFITIPSSLSYSRNGRAIGAITLPCFLITCGVICCWKLVLVVHSGPMGRLRDRSYCSFVSNGNGTD